MLCVIILPLITDNFIILLFFAFDSFFQLRLKIWLQSNIWQDGLIGLQICFAKYLNKGTGSFTHSSR